MITGASAGVGRAIARSFARRGAHIGLLARGKAGLEAACRDVEELGGKALAIATDVAHADEVEAAAIKVEETSTVGLVSLVGGTAWLKKWL